MRQTKNAKGRTQDPKITESAAPKPVYETPVVMMLSGVPIGTGQACSSGDSVTTNCNSGFAAPGQHCNAGDAATGAECKTGPTALNGCNPGSTAGIGCTAGNGAGLSG